MYSVKMLNANKITAALNAPMKKRLAVFLYLR